MSHMDGLLVCPGPTAEADLRDHLDRIRLMRPMGCLRVLAIGEAGLYLFPDADWFYHCDAKFWQHYVGLGRFSQKQLDRSYSILEPELVTQLHVVPGTEFQTEWPRVWQGTNSGFQAINLAYHLGLKRVGLVGYNAQRVDGQTHFFTGRDPKLIMNSPYAVFADTFTLGAPSAKEAGMEIINCTTRSAVSCFPKQSLDEFLSGCGPSR